MKIRCLLLGAVLAAILWVPAVSAQSSFVNANTFGVFTNDVDAFMDPNDYSGVEFEQFFGYVQGGRNAPSAAQQPSTSGIAAGFATRLKNGLYTGFFFDGNLWEGTWIDTKNDDGKRVDSSAPDGQLTFDGLFGLLLGNNAIGGIKITVDFDQVKHNYNLDEPGTKTETWDTDGFLTLGAAWGKNFDFRGGSLSPEISLGYQISTYINETKSTKHDYSYVPDPLPAGKTLYDYMSHLLIGVETGYAFADPSKFLWLGYNLDIGILPSPYIKKETANTEEKFKGHSVDNTLGVAFYKTVDLAERFQLGFGLGTDLTLGFRAATDKDQTVEFGIAPHLETGIIYDFAKKPFSLNAGLQLAPTDTNATPVVGGIGMESAPLYTVTSTKADKGKKAETITGTYKPLGINVGLGLDFNPISNFSLGMNLTSNLVQFFGLKDDLSFNVQNIFQYTGTFTFGLMATFRL